MHKISFQEETINSAFKRAVLIIAFVFGFIYILLPGPNTVFDFPPLPNSYKSDLDGDTWQNPNIIAFYSDFRREEITRFYQNFYSKSVLFGLPLPMISLNHPPEEAYRYVRDQQESTFLEEYTFPLRGTIFVNGYEPKVENDRYPNRTRSFVGDHIFYKDKYFNSKTTLRYYPSRKIYRVIVYLGVWMSGFGIYQAGKKLLRHD